MTDTDITSQRGEQFQLTGQITKGGVAWPPSWVGASVVFEAKRSKADAVPLVIKTSGGGGVSTGAGGGYTVQINKADTSGFTRTELLEYEVRLVEQDLTETVVAEGTWRVRLAVGS